MFTLQCISEQSINFSVCLCAFYLAFAGDVPRPVLPRGILLSAFTLQLFPLDIGILALSISHEIKYFYASPFRIPNLSRSQLPERVAHSYEIAFVFGNTLSPLIPFTPAEQQLVSAMQVWQCDGRT